LVVSFFAKYFQLFDRKKITRGILKMNFSCDYYGGYRV
jgi:hypothetical protein